MQWIGFNKNTNPRINLIFVGAFHPKSVNLLVNYNVRKGICTLPQKMNRFVSPKTFLSFRVSGIRFRSNVFSSKCGGSVGKGLFSRTIESSFF